MPLPLKPLQCLLKYIIYRKPVDWARPPQISSPREKLFIPSRISDRLVVAHHATPPNIVSSVAIRSEEHAKDPTMLHPFVVFYHLEVVDELLVLFHLEDL